MPRILVIQDTMSEGQQVRLSLESEGFEVEVVADAEEGLERFRAGRFDLVLSETLTPGLSGYDLCREIKAEPRGAVPVVFFTGLDGPLDIMRGLEAGAEDYILKPCPPGRLAGRVRGILNSRALAAKREREEEAHILRDGRLAGPSPWRTEPVLEPPALELHSALDGFPEGLALVDASGTLLALNRAWRELPLSMGISRRGANYLEACLRAGKGALAVAEAIREVVAGRSEVSLDHLGDDTRQKRWFRVRVTRVPGRTPAVLLACWDVTDHRRTEDALQRAEGELRELQQLETLGRLTSGAAHDFNNLLTAISGYADLLLSALEPVSPLRKDLEEIKRAGQRAASLTRQFLAFTKRQVIEPREVDLNAVVGDLRRMLQRLMGEDIELTTSLAPAVARIKADPGLIEQVILNLSLHAREIAPAGSKLTLETADVCLDQSQWIEPCGVKPGRYVMLAVSSVTRAVDAEALAQLFEPGGSSREAGANVPLGLSAVHAIVKQCGGYLWVAGDPERGTSFTVCFPQLDDALRPEAGAPSAEPLAAGGTLLLVEDEDGVRAVTRRFLESSGYQVLEAGDGAEALRICRSHTGRIDLVLTDVVMPKLSGPKLAERATLLHPETRVLYISGYADRAIVASGLLPSQSALLQKPFTRTALLSKVREMLAPHWPRPRPEASEPKTPSHPE